MIITLWLGLTMPTDLDIYLNLSSRRRSLQPETSSQAHIASREDILTLKQQARQAVFKSLKNGGLTRPRECYNCWRDPAPWSKHSRLHGHPWKGYTKEHAL